MVIVRLVVALGLLLVTAPAWAQALPPAGLQGFSIVLVLGEVQDGAPADNIPAAARAALGDLRDFLPYRSYRVLDTAWVLASSATRQAVGSRLQGPDEQSYEITLDRMPVGASSLQVGFVMREPNGNADRRAGDREARLRKQLAQLGGSVEAGGDAAAESWRDGRASSAHHRNGIRDRRSTKRKRDPLRIRYVRL